MNDENPPPGAPPPPSPGNTSYGRVVAGAVGGVFLFVLINAVVEVGPLRVGRPAVLQVAMPLLLLAAAFGGGGYLVKTSASDSGRKGLGLGLMIGWALVSILSAGWCTGLNPAYYG
ncbi:hypothetical protein F4561_005469 [Lipingzhangella halophila]|uniref:Uncharacterized protein n=1 Tax=Lipingzhangella halophila TaxID=1783352 RepID=A0A7W7W686_9ACTN|nr:hypothetical protein [Lipingzhangella halophila]MBB4934649.1 hypothetical protein [Lipingzhangella halophila]